MEARKKWRSFGWEGSLLLIGALAAGVFGGGASCEGGTKTGALGPGGAGQIAGGSAGGRFGGDEVVASAAQAVSDGPELQPAICHPLK